MLNKAIRLFDWPIKTLLVADWFQFMIGVM